MNESSLRCDRCGVQASARVWGVALCPACYGDWHQAEWTSDGWMMERLKLPKDTGMLEAKDEQRYHREFERLTGLWAKKGRP